MGRYKSSLDQLIVLPSYKLDSNLILLPGIIYNVTFSRFKAAALLSRYKHQISKVPLVENLLNEYDFGDESSDSENIPGMLSKEAVKGIRSFFEFEQKFRTDTTSSSSSSAKSEPENEFDWLVLGIVPNLDKIKEPSETDLKDVYGNIVTIVRIVGIIDDTSNIKLTLQALTRGARIKSGNGNSFKANESLIKVDWNALVQNLNVKHEELDKNINALFKSIDSFTADYRQALAVVGDTTNSKWKDKDLLTLNPLANALYLQLTGSKDFTKAYASLKKLLGSLNMKYANASSSSNSPDSRNFLRFIDLISAIIPFPNHEKLKVLNQFEINDRINQVNAMVTKMTLIFENLKKDTSFINHWFYSEATNIQRANVVANQLKSIRLVLEGMTNKTKSSRQNGNQNAIINNSKKLIRRKNVAPREEGDDDVEDNLDDDDDGDDELRAITNFIKNKLPTITSLSNDSKRLIIKDFKRIKNSPPGNSDFHVIRNYLDIVVDLPWDRFQGRFDSNKDIDVILAKKQLDKDHYGLEHVKTRLIQYLVVLKLMGINAETEFFKKEHEREKIELDKKIKENEEIERKKFMREQYSNESIIIPNNDETSLAHKQAKNENKKSQDLTLEIKRKQEQANQQNQAKLKIISSTNKSPILMLAGPPGVGKTSLAKSVATVLGRNFQRISLGGVKDESEIRGHRRTYVGAMPGMIVQAIRKARCMNPVILLDEIDKIVGGNNGSQGGKINGDPAAALLEVLDPEQNNSFLDHYLGFPIDLSQVMFICTANEPYNLSRPLLDRLEMIELGAYDYSEKLVIGSRYLLPRQLKRNGLPGDDLIKINADIMKKIIIDYTREAGVRNFERKLGTICRHKAVEYAESLDGKPYHAEVEEFDLPKYLGIPYGKLTNEVYDSPAGSNKYGIVNGLSYNSDGSGSVLIFELIGFPGSGLNMSLNMTGRLGEVLMESGKIGLLFIKSILSRKLIHLDRIEQYDEEIFNKLKNLEIHLHVPAGSISKDGPSAGITMALLFLSLILEKPVSKDIAMTGEITLRGLVLPIGGLREKMLGASLSGIKKIIVPRENRKDIIEEYIKHINQPEKLNEILMDDENTKVGDRFKFSQPEDFVYKKYGLQICYAKEFWDVIRHAWGDSMLVKVDETKIVEYHI